jgi:hypothetical protein
MVPCPAGCDGGQITIPKMEFDYKGEPIVTQDVLTCIVCHGNGVVEV